jgi:hypothetical protein
MTVHRFDNPRLITTVVRKPPYPYGHRKFIEPKDRKVA